MKKLSLLESEIRSNLKNESERLDEANKYIEFSKKFNKQEGVSGPFDAKFKNDPKAKKEYMSKLSKAWADYKKKHGTVSKKAE